MKLEEVVLLCGCFYAVYSHNTPQDEGRPLQSDSVFAAVHADAVLPCRTTRHIRLPHVDSLEWVRLGAPFNRTVHVVRRGKELEKEKAMEYRGRTTVMSDGSLKLHDIKLNDTSSYMCVLEGSPVERKVSLIVAEVLDLHIGVHRSSACQLFVTCESSVWNLQPNISLLDGNGKVVATGAERTVRQRNLHSVKVSVRVDAAEGNQKGNRTLVCRLDISEAELVEEKKLLIIDDYVPSVTCSVSVMIAITLAGIVVVLLVLLVPTGMIEDLRFSLKGFRRRMSAWRAVAQRGDRDDNELGDVCYAPSTGASDKTVELSGLRREGLLLAGVQASHTLAGRDQKPMLRFREKIIQVGERHHISPSLIAAIISKQSAAGTLLKPNGCGQFDHSCFGLMQINKAFFATSGSPFSVEHIEDGTKHLIHLIKTLQNSDESKQWAPVQHVKGALIAYISGIDKVKARIVSAVDVDQLLEDLDHETPTADFANDVFARAEWFASNGY